MPEANDLTVCIMALAAQAKREAISRRTTEALAMAKARGSSRAIRTGRAGRAGVALREVVRGNSVAFAAELRQCSRSAGWRDLGRCAQWPLELDARGIRTGWDGRRHVPKVRNLM